MYIRQNNAIILRKFPNLRKVSAGVDMDGKIKIKGQLKFYMQWPVILSILLMVMDVLVFTVSVKARSGSYLSGCLHPNRCFPVFS